MNKSKFNFWLSIWTKFAKIQAGSSGIQNQSASVYFPADGVIYSIASWTIDFTLIFTQFSASDGKEAAKVYFIILK